MFFFNNKCLKKELTISLNSKTFSQPHLMAQHRSRESQVRSPFRSPRCRSAPSVDSSALGRRQWVDPSEVYLLFITSLSCFLCNWQHSLVWLVILLPCGLLPIACCCSRCSCCGCSSSHPLFVKTPQTQYLPNLLADPSSFTNKILHIPSFPGLLVARI